LANLIRSSRAELPGHALKRIKGSGSMNNCTAVRGGFEMMAYIRSTPLSTRGQMQTRAATGKPQSVDIFHAGRIDRTEAMSIACTHATGLLVRMTR
jgi:hypothetical protein